MEFHLDFAYVEFIHFGIILFDAKVEFAISQNI
jgi:hypothetical protein